ncbi:apoptosis-antagonizing transcription factor [Calycina marina]|uniref:Protein BFR2 n=1 Tax=Calycina marina TaxID=1763456 RepID=A0A9P7YWS1_9HELO|nr:apoptosis-antagonizing transcription factor [Calycina marina]
MGKIKSRAQQLAELSDPKTKDFDPEADDHAQVSDEESGSSDSEDDLAGTEHYEEVGKSRLRKKDEVSLGPQYAGSRISREALLADDFEDGSGSNEENSEAESQQEDGTKFANLDYEDLDMDGDDGEIDSDVALGESDAEKFKEFAFRGSSKPAKPKNKFKGLTAADFMSDSGEEDVTGDGESEGGDAEGNLLDVEEQHVGPANATAEVGNIDEDDEDHSEGSDEDEESVDGSEVKSENGSTDDDEEKSRRAELRKIMNEEEKSVVATISQAAKADAEKGMAVKQQRKTFDSLLGTRMVLQKGLIAVNTISSEEKSASEEVGEEAYQGAEDAAIKLWNILDGMRRNLAKEISNAKAGQKRKRALESSAPSSKLWERMQNLEVASIDSRQATLEKWWSKAKGSSTPLTGKLNNNVTPMSLTSVIQDQLAKSEPLERTKRPRSCAPIQEKAKVLTDASIYDDTTLYKTLLNQLVEQRKADSGLMVGGANAPAQWAVKEAKMRKIVDTKASKGRKLRFTVHEKLQNFMAPEDRGSWEPQATDRFFSTLLGHKMTLREENFEIVDENMSDEEGLRLF